MTTSCGLLAETGTGVAHCPISNMKLSSGVARIPEMLRLGVPVGLAVDGSRQQRRLRLLMEELRVCYLLHRLTSSREAPSGYDVLEDGHARQRPPARAATTSASSPSASARTSSWSTAGSWSSSARAYDPRSVLGTVGLRGPVDYTVVQRRRSPCATAAL